MGSRYHVRVDGSGFLVREGSYSRVAGGRPVAEWREWEQSDWRRGDGQRGQGDAGRWSSGYGVEASSPERLGLGPELVESYASGEDGFPMMAVYGGDLYALAGSSGKVYRFDGSAWTMAHDTTKAALRSAAVHGGKLYVGSGADGAVVAFDGAAWSTAFTIAGASAIGAMCGYLVWDPVAKASVGRLFVGAEFPSGVARVFAWDGTAASEVFACGHGRVEAMAVYRGRLFVATSETGSGIQGRIWAHDGRGSSGEWEEVAWIPDNYVAGWCAFDNLLFCGSGVGGKVWAFDGGRLVEAYDLLDQGVLDPGELRGLAASGGRLFVGYEHPVLGAAVLSKLPASAVLGSVLAIAGGSGAVEMESCRLGWSTPSGTGEAGSVGSAVSYGGELFLARDSDGAAKVYRRSGSTFRTSGRCELSELSDGAPGAVKLFRKVTVSHEALRLGESVGVWFRLDGAEAYQVGESFSSLGGCDVAQTTASWRPSEGLVRLKGMARMTLAGKVPGDGVARWTVDGRTSVPPAEISTEFTAGEYSAVAAVDGVEALISSGGGQSFVHEVYEFDLAGMEIHGIRPAAVAWGEGDSFGSLGRSVNLGIWNHATSYWDSVGSNSAGSGDSQAAKTIEGSILPANLAPYLGPAGKVYLRLRTGYRGSDLHPSRLGVDAVYLEACYAPSGDAVSSGILLPGGGLVDSATLRLVSSNVPVGTSIDLYLSADGGSIWEGVADGVEHLFSTAGSELRWKAVLTASPNGKATPEISELAVAMSGGWLELGRSEVAGSTSRELGFGESTRGGRLGIRLELTSGSTDAGPVVTGVGVQYARAVTSRREWGFDMVCEGAPGLPLRLLDGSLESRSGAELSRLLWAAREREVVSFEDLDGTVYTVWFVGLDERLGSLVQERGAQTVARCRLVEC